jgi:hypothetical protein
MNQAFEYLFLRRPRIDYISPPICEALFSSSGGPVIVLNPLTPQSFPTGLILGGVGNFTLSWDAYPGALCYSIYKADTANPFGSYTIVAECIPNPPIDLTPFGPGHYRVSAITPNGETPLSDPIQVGEGTCPAIIAPLPSEILFATLGGSATIGPFIVDPGTGFGPLIYRWYRNDTFLEDTTATTQAKLEIPVTVPADFSDYALHLNNSAPACSLVSDTIELFCNPQAWWKMDEIGDATVPRVDSVQGILANGFNSVINTPGLINNAVFFSGGGGTDSHVQTGFTHNLPNAGTGFALTGWYNIAVSDPSQIISTEYRLFISMTFTVTWTNDVFTLQLFDSTHTLKSTIVYPKVLALNQWYYYRAWYDPVTAEIGFQVNDSAIGAIVTTPANYAVPASSQGSFFVGTDNGTYSAKADETGIFPIPISDAQSDYLWNSRSGRSYPF